ncbi:PREDICTED: protein AATF-like [Amphimedon queenslandica]|uniref:Protein AATF n=1 Tax=Amphimedon queenslandica TaxID=400682 RepID=A0A1X7V1F1_AMPQE|nr:PREDICTED: protein AATF-like [Amphimedon queenslandica]|eukprot:XP_003386173.1 PREDICTED: protein AATF-like [Amphimedon queenslandica]
MWSRRKKKAGTLAEEINSLVDPRPNYEREEEEEETAKICEGEYLEGDEEEEEEEGELNSSHFEGGYKRRLSRQEEEEDPKYGGQSISRDEMNDYDTPESSDDDILSEGEEGEEEEEGEDILSEGEGDNDETDSEEEEEEEEREVGGASSDSQEDSSDVFILPLDKGRTPAATNEDDVDKGKAVKHQLALWDGLLEGRIKLQKCLSLTNQLPQNETATKFSESGPLASTSLNQCETSLNKLMRNLLELQETLIAKSLDSAPEEEEEKEEEGGDWYEGIIEKRHKRLRCYRNKVLEKWSTRLQLASGKLTMKSYSYQSRQQSAVSNIEFALKDQAKLRKRTQLKRTQQQLVTLGKRKREGGAERDSHLNDADEEIFNDEDFYHQLLRELIQSKTSFTDNDTDQVSMGKKWLEIQSLRAKVKKKVDTKASKGRKLRYHVHQKLVGLMAPINSCNYSESARYNLFSSLFDSRKIGNSNYTDTTN